MTAPSVAERLALHSELRASGCIEWTGYRNAFGYGIIAVDRKARRAHRVAYSLQHGDVAEDLEVDHLCHNRACINVDHLRAVPKWVNMQNRTLNENSTTGARGVMRSGSGYGAQLYFNGRKLWLGTFPTVAEAERAVNEKRAELQTAAGIATGGDATK